MNLLYYGDNLDVLRRHVKDESVDLVYLDPPFNSSQDYNVLFAEQNGTRSAAQIKAFEDTWRWDQGADENRQRRIIKLTQRCLSEIRRLEFRDAKKIWQLVLLILCRARSYISGRSRKDKS